MNFEQIKNWLKEFNQLEVDNYLNYLQELKNAKKKNKQTWKYEEANPWIKFKTDEDFTWFFKKVSSKWLILDWKHITIQSTWLSFDYIAYKNLMLIVYPESIIDLQLVYNWDEINFWKENGKIAYKHKLANPFLRNENEIIWWYCVIKNKRWEFLTTLNKQELEKHRKVAKTDTIWSAWLTEMCLKTVLKKAVKIHFDDIYSEILDEDNKENDLENSKIDIELSWKKEIDNIENIEELKKYYLKNKWKWKEFDKYVTIRKNILLSKEQKNENS